MFLLGVSYRALAPFHARSAPPIPRGAMSNEGLVILQHPTTTSDTILPSCRKYSTSLRRLGMVSRSKSHPEGRGVKGLCLGT